MPRSTEELLKAAEKVANRFNSFHARCCDPCDNNWKNSMEDARLIAGLSAKLREREWQDISTAPKDGEAVIIVDGERDLYTSSNSGGGWETVCLGDVNTDYPIPTHWQILPAPPKKEG